MCCCLEHFDLEVGVNFGGGLWKINVSILNETGVVEAFAPFFESLVGIKHELRPAVMVGWGKKEDCCVL